MVRIVHTLSNFAEHLLKRLPDTLLGFDFMTTSFDFFFRIEGDETFRPCHRAFVEGLLNIDFCVVGTVLKLVALVPGQEVDSQKVDRQKVDSQKVEIQNIKRQKVDRQKVDKQ
jgi:hypothetical protein